MPFGLNIPGKWRLPLNLAALFTGVHHNYRNVKQKYTLVGKLDPSSEEFTRAIEAVTGAPHAVGNHLHPLIDGDQIFPAMLEAIGAAKSTVNFLTYVYWSGEIAHTFADVLSKQARAGIECNLLLDAVGAGKIDKKLIKQMNEAGVHIVRFRPVTWNNLSRLDNRTHRKVLVVDGKVGFTGGVGIAEEWTGHAQDPKHWRDTHVKVEGPAVRGLQGAFCANWLEATGQVLASEKYLPHLEAFPDGVRAQVTRSEAGKGDTNIETLFFLALAAASERIWLTTAYFAPRQAFIEALGAAVERGVDVRIIVPGPYADKFIVRANGRKTYKKLLKYGVKLYEYQPTMIHAKTITIDRAWSTIGSANFDNRSFALNDEANISVQDPKLAAALDAQFEQDQKLSKPITLENWKHRSTPEKAAEFVSSLVKREV